MENTLKEVNAVLGVYGSFVCLADGSLAAQVMPEQYTDDHLNLAARVTSQTFHALDLSGQRVAEAMLLFSNSRLVLKTFYGGILVILCARNINLPLLNLTVNVAVRKLAAETRSRKATAPVPSAPQPGAPSATAIAAPAPSMAPVTPSLSTTHAAVELPSLVSELQTEAQQIIQAASGAQVPLWVMDPVALWQRCQEHRRFLAVPQRRYLELAGQSAHTTSIIQLLERLGYQNNTRASTLSTDADVSLWAAQTESRGSPRADTLPTPRRLLFTETKKSINLAILLDTFEMYHRFDLKPFLRPNEPILPVTALALMRLQLVEMPDEVLSDLVALFIEYDVSLVPKADQVDASQITALCVDDWGWYKTISMNLEQLIYFSEDSLSLAERNVVIERARRLKSSMDAVPKSLRWQARARLGETVRWYETPIKPGALFRPDMTIG